MHLAPALGHPIPLAPVPSQPQAGLCSPGNKGVSRKPTGTSICHCPEPSWLPVETGLQGTGGALLGCLQAWRDLLCLLGPLPASPSPCAAAPSLCSSCYQECPVASKATNNITHPHPVLTSSSLSQPCMTHVYHQWEGFFI